MKKLSVLLLSLALTSSVLAGCGGESGGNDRGGGSSNKDPYTAIAYSEDTEYSYLYSSEITTFNYLATSVSQNQKALANFVDSLIEYDQYGNVVPCLAESWETSDDQLTWTFHLRKNAKWYDCDGNEIAPVTAKDFVDSARLVANAEFNSDMPDMLISYIVNGIELYNKVISDYTQLGVEATDDYTLVYHLRQPCAYFLTLLTYGCYMPVNGEYYESLKVEGETVTKNDGTVETVTNKFGTDRDKILYNGAYICSEWLPQEKFVWIRNDNYWDKDKIYITRTVGTYNAQADSIAPEMYLRGEIDECSITTSILDDWLNSENAKYVHSSLPSGIVTYMLLNFTPHFDDAVASDNYKIAVNNKNFRKSIFYGLNKKYSLSAYDPNNTDEILTNRMMPNGFVTYEGKDYNEFGNDILKFNDDPFNEAEALKHKEAATEELKTAGATLPISMPLYYNPSSANQDQCCQLIEKQLESLLGTDYIDITVYAGPSTNYIGEVRRPGLWGLFEAGWGPDYSDPATFFEPFSYGWTYGSQENIEGDEYKTGYTYTQEDYDKGIITKEDLIGQPQYVFNSLIEKARAETQDMAKRYELFSEAEAYALEEVLLMPYRLQNNGYVASNMTIFDRESSMAGICGYKLKGRHMLEHSYSQEQFEAARAKWEKEKTEA